MLRRGEGQQALSTARHGASGSLQDAAGKGLHNFLDRNPLNQGMLARGAAMRWKIGHAVRLTSGLEQIKNRPRCILPRSELRQGIAVLQPEETQMTDSKAIELRRLDPHDPLPESGSYVLVIRRLAEDTPGGTRLEILRASGPGLPAEEPVPFDLAFEDAIGRAQDIARLHRIRMVYAVDRTAGPREQDVLQQHGDHSFAAEALEDTDPEDGEQGTDIRDRPRDAGYGPTPRG
jgi:hypothetical protein